MCIRDRDANTRVVLPTTRRCGEVEVKLSRLADLDLARHGHCLLYTSDAADERSSVDLGGRRIIKKKKNTHAHVATTQRHNSNTLS